MALGAQGRAWHDGDMRAITTLTLVRQQLDELAYFRLDSNLGPELGETYRALCDEERELLTRQVTGS
jgi:hypothetical protein